MTIKDRIINQLTTGLAPVHLDVQDESHQHQGHGGWREGGETHFRVVIVSEQFAGKSRVDRHRLVNTLLATELADRVHALAITARSPDEVAHDKP